MESNQTSETNLYLTSPETFADLNQLCINVNNVSYNDFILNQSYPATYDGVKVQNRNVSLSRETGQHF